MPATEWGWEITAEELRLWTVYEDEQVLVINKPGGVVCHPSKQGPWSSLIGACREYLGVARLHMPSRLDRETSGVVVFAKQQETARRLQSAIQRREVEKTYLAVLWGEAQQPFTVTEPLGRDEGGPFYSRQWVRPDGQSAETHFTPLTQEAGMTLARIQPYTGRLHQIRVHAAWAGFPVVGDKLYPDPAPMMAFLEQGYTPALAEGLLLPRHALHAWQVCYHTERGEERFTASLTSDLQQFITERFSDADRLLAEMA